jgi:hypothetical protein
MTDTMSSQNIDLSSWDTPYMSEFRSNLWLPEVWQKQNVANF